MSENMDVDDMRYELAEREAMNMNVADIINLLVEGCEGLDNVADIDIIEEYNNTLGLTTIKISFNVRIMKLTKTQKAKLLEHEMGCHHKSSRWQRT